MRNQSTRYSGWFTAALILTMLMPALCGAQDVNAPGQMQFVEKTPYITPDYVDPRPLDMIVATSALGELNMEKVMEYCYYNHLSALAGLNIGMVNQLPNDMLTNVIRHMVSRKIATDKLYADGNQADIRKASQNYDYLKSRMLIGQLFKEEVSDKLTSPTAEMIQTYYDKHQIEYMQHFQFKMRHLILLTYEPYVVKAGDTLESIARDVSGDPAQAENIRSDEDQKPIRKSEAENQPPLYEGEKLLVPMPEKRAQAVRERLVEILKQLDQGKTFEDLAKEYSQGMMAGKVIGPLPSGTRDMLPDLMEIAHETPVGQVSRIFETKHGYQVIQIVEKQEERQKTLAEVRDDIVRVIKNNQQNDLLEELIDKLFSNPDLEVDYDKIAKGDMLTSDTVIAQLGDTKILWEDAEKTWVSNGRPTDKKKIEDQVVRAIPALLIALTEQWAKPILENPESSISRELSALKPEKVGQAYMEMLARRAAANKVDDAAIDAFYEANKDKYFKEAPAVKFITMVMVVPPDTVTTLNETQLAEELDKLHETMTEQLKDVKSVEEFEAMAATVNTQIIEKGVNPPGSGDDFVPVNKVEQKLVDQLADLEPGQWTKPFKYSDRSVMSILIEDKRPEMYQPLEQVREKARALAEKAEAVRELDALEEQYVKQAGLEIKL